ncbi:efflux RND transporter periplasmic adaptor subunit [Brevibacillus migulae]|uniref:efflux RND transporter periplasmic adaptor subunit n=1 Tax=Brevibacillus migulae TaxID=1644114 RepID=UPI00106DE246|nr:efflux RND transporter periplasmic adaptor subunit [Brevibacillus migulae]
MNTKSKRAVTWFALLTSLSFAVVGCSDNAQPAGNAQAAVPAVKVWNVGSGQDSGITASGKVTAAEEIQAVSKLSGKVAQVLVKEGDIVKPGQVLVQLDSSDYVQQVRQAESAIASAQARLADTKAGARSQELDRLRSVVEQAKASQDVAQSTFNRMKALYESGAISQSEYEKVTLELEKARTGYVQAQAQLDLAQAGATSNSLAALQAEVDRLKSSLELAKITLSNTNVTSPIAGVVARRSIDPGEMASPGVPLLTIVKMDEVKVEASIPQDQINQVKVGGQVTLRVSSLEDKHFTGTVEFVSPISDANNSTFPVKIRVSNQEGLLRAGMLADVILSEQAAPAGLKIPASTVIEKEGKSYVYKLDGDVVHQVAITQSGKQADWVEITGGLASGDKIVMNPTAQLSDGSKVRVN